MKKNRSGSGSISVVIVDKSSGRHKESHPIGIANDESEVIHFRLKNLEWLRLRKLQKHPEPDLYGEERRAWEYEMEMTGRVVANIDKILINDAIFARKIIQNTLLHPKIHHKYIILTN
ncbi:MAG: hypothetical protein K6C30_08885 [Bacteroidaceae bacterium]|nr:hypothetical protein [Bacteroidaceae bacterium]